MKRLCAIATFLMISAAGAAEKAPAPKQVAAAPVASVPQPMAAPIEAENLAACASLEAAIESGEQELAWIRASGMADNSAPRETTRLLSKLIEQQRQSQHLAMMIAMKCPRLPVRTLSEGIRYLVPAMDCYTARLRKGSETQLDVCRRQNWVPMGESAASAPQ